jgi:hypothetical protein
MRLPRFLGGSPKPESAEVAAHGEFPAGLRLAVVKAVPGETDPWEIITHPAEKLVSIRRLGDSDALGPVFQLPEEHLAALVAEKGALLHPKKLEAIRAGRWLEGFEPGTYFSAIEPPEGKQNPDNLVPDSVYTIPHGELIRYLLDNTQVLLSDHAAETAKPKDDAVQGDGGGDGGRTGAQPADG